MQRRPLENRTQQSRHSGYSLVEVMIVVGILGVMAAMAIPSFTHMKERREVNAMVTALNADIRLTKTEAVKRGRRVTVCPTQTPDDAVPACGRLGDDWAEGWVVFVDDGPTPGEIDQGEPIIRVQQKFSGNGMITNNILGSMSFQATGLPVGMLASSFVIRPDKNTTSPSNLTTTLTLSGPGRVNIQKYQP